MVNWREDIEFFYVLFILVSLIVAFFSFEPLWGVERATAATIGIGVLEAVVGLIVFESESAVGRWSRLSKS